MSDKNRNKRKSIDILKEKLYQNDYKAPSHERSELTYHPKPEQTEWKHEQNDNETDRKVKSSSKQINFWVKIFFIALFFFLGSLGYSYYSFTNEKNRISSDRIDIELITRSFVEGGESLPLEVRVTNQNHADINDASLIIEYPGRSELTGELESRSIPISSISSGASQSEKIDIFLFGEAGEEKVINAKLEYNVSQATSTFAKEESTIVTISTTPLLVSISGAEATVPGQIYNYLITVSSNKDSQIEDVYLDLDIPNTFEVIDATPPPISGTSTWDLKNIPSGEHKTISLQGAYNGLEGDEFILKGFVGIKSQSEDSLGVIFHSNNHAVSLTEPFLAANLIIDGVEGESNVTASSGDDIDVEIYYRNNTDTEIRDVILSVNLSGTAYSKENVDPNQGFFDSAINTIRFDKTNVKDLEILDPSEDGSITFSVESLPLVNTGNAIIKEPEIRFVLDIEGKGEGGGEEVVKEASTATVRINSGVTLSTSTLYHSGPFANQGPMPPKVEEETTYTLLWSLRNSANVIEAATVKTSLPSYVKWLDNYSPDSEILTYDPEDHTVIWEIEEISDRIGYSKDTLDIAFQVALTPSVSQFGQAPSLTEEVTFEGTDSFTGKLLRTSKKKHTTRLENDVSGGGQKGVVVR